MPNRTQERIFLALTFKVYAASLAGLHPSLLVEANFDKAMTAFFICNVSASLAHFVNSRKFINTSDPLGVMNDR